MKGFIYLLEIAVASILIVIVLSTFFSTKVKQNWETSDLVSGGNNMLNAIKYSKNISNILSGNLSELDSIKPANVKYGLEIKGSPKSVIKVGCVEYCSYVNQILTPAYVNGRLINFTVEYFDINALNYIPSDFDAVVFVNYTGYSSRKSNITDYLSKGGVIIGINATSGNNPDFNEIFNLTIS
jgi:hypothetical protein